MCVFTQEDLPDGNFYSAHYAPFHCPRPHQDSGAAYQDRPGACAAHHHDHDHHAVSGKKPASRPHSAITGRIVKTSYAKKNPDKVTWVTDKK